MLLHGFDSSVLEMRRLHPLLARQREAWAVDLVGWGFTDAGFGAQPEGRALGPPQKRAHLLAFWRDEVQSHYALSCGASFLL